MEVAILVCQTAQVEDKLSFDLFCEYIEDRMKLFINDIPIVFCTRDELQPLSDYATIIDGSKQSIRSGKINYLDDVLIQRAPKEMIKDLFELMTDKKLKKVDSVTVEIRNLKNVKNYIKSVFTIVKAGGGIASLYKLELFTL